MIRGTSAFSIHPERGVGLHSAVPSIFQAQEIWGCRAPVEHMELNYDSSKTSSAHRRRLAWPLIFVANRRAMTPL
jgi:hypothetical protein